MWAVSYTQLTAAQGRTSFVLNVVKSSRGVGRANGGVSSNVFALHDEGA